MLITCLKVLTKWLTTFNSYQPPHRAALLIQAAIGGKTKHVYMKITDNNGYLFYHIEDGEIIVDDIKAFEQKNVQEKS